MPRPDTVPTMPLSEKGPHAPRPTLTGAAEQLARELEAWPGVIARAHWDIGDDTTVTGADFYVGEQELGHIHFGGEAHVPIGAVPVKQLIAEGRAKPFPWSRAWATWQIDREPDIAIAKHLFELSLARTVRAR